MPARRAPNPPTHVEATLSRLLEVHQALAAEMEAVFPEDAVGPSPVGARNLQKWMDEIRDIGDHCQYGARTFNKMRRQHRIITAVFGLVGFGAFAFSQFSLALPIFFAVGALLWTRFHKTEIAFVLHTMGWNPMDGNTNEAGRLHQVSQRLWALSLRHQPEPYDPEEDDLRTIYEARRFAIERTLGLLAWVGQKIEMRQRILNLAQWVESQIRDKPDLAV